jgi:hypothetical protein
MVRKSARTSKLSERILMHDYSRECSKRQGWAKIFVLVCFLLVFGRSAPASTLELVHKIEHAHKVFHSGPGHTISNG